MRQAWATPRAANASSMLGHPQPRRRASSLTSRAGAPYSAAKNTSENATPPGSPVVSLYADSSSAPTAQRTSRPTTWPAGPGWSPAVTEASPLHRALIGVVSAHRPGRHGALGPQCGHRDDDRRGEPRELQPAARSPSQAQVPAQLAREPRPEGGHRDHCGGHESDEDSGSVAQQRTHHRCRHQDGHAWRQRERSLGGSGDSQQPDACDQQGGREAPASRHGGEPSRAVPRPSEPGRDRFCARRRSQG